MTLKKKILTAALCTGFIATLAVSSSAAFAQNEAFVTVAKVEKVAPMERGPHVLPPV
ncbi:hypothetical protein QWY14_12415 [Planococcus sp. N028]|uniref:Uncharacterized protein n=1 Tax=Planococcus shixiaomingii TaxID=3058393 RepID=A0ABT8N3Y6_9BACL|nr:MULTISPECIES: hypothetical protein [unclassified Planococcus (in: firmicutes)]MDN7242609.1 hypothetical protein [Planococcus sp. N028]WKA55757.1 hypothetical protein QWY21_05035 [Planococcus sp. N022]